MEKIVEDDKTNLTRLSELQKLYEEWMVKAARPEIQARIEYEKNPRSMDDIASLLARGTGKMIIDEVRKVIGEFFSPYEAQTALLSHKRVLHLRGNYGKYQRRERKEESDCQTKSYMVHDNNV